MATTTLGRIVLWVVVPVATCAVVVGTHHSHVWFFYDEWGIVERAVAPGSDVTKAFSSFNGRLWAMPYIVYAFQTRVLGIDSHLFAYAVLCGSLVALNVALAAALRTLGVPAILALAAAAVATYLGSAAQLSVFAVLFSWNLALALAFVAVAVVATRASGLGPAAVIAGLLLGASLADSGIATIGVVLVAAFSAWCWRDRFVLVAILPATLTLILWTAFTSDKAFVEQTSLGERMEIGARLLLEAAGALVGGGRVAGGIALLAAGAVVTRGIMTRRVCGTLLGSLIAGAVATLAAIAAIVQSRADLLTHGFFEFNRYIGVVAILLLVALLPSLAATLSSSRDRERVVTFAATGAAVLVFVLNLGPFYDYRDGFDSRSRRVHERAAQAVAIVEDGCPVGGTLRPDARPFGELSPQVTMALLQELVERDLLTIRASPPAPELVASICRDAPERAADPVS